MNTMMNVLLIISTAAISMDSVAAGSQTGVNLYGKRYTNLDVDTILNSDRLVRNYVDCLLSRKPCSPEGKELKRLLPEALRTKCGKCSNHQKESALRVLTKLYTTYPNYYNDLREKWDPSGEYHRKYEEYLKEEQFNSIGDDHTQQDFYETSSNNLNNPSYSLPSAGVSSTTYKPDGSFQNPDNSVSLANRFGDDDEDVADSAPAPARPARPANIAPATNDTNDFAYLPPPTSSSNSTSNIDKHVDTTSTTVRPPRTTETVGGGTLVPAASSPSAAGTVVDSPNTTVDRPTRPPTLIDALFPINNGQQNRPLGVFNDGPFGLSLIKRIGNKITNTAEFFAEMVRNTVKHLHHMQRVWHPYAGNNHHYRSLTDHRYTY